MTSHCPADWGARLGGPSLTLRHDREKRAPLARMELFTARLVEPGPGASRARVRLFWWKAELRARRYCDDVRARAYAVAVKCAHPKVVSGICA